LQQGLQEGGRSRTAGRARHRLQNTFVTVEFGLSLILLIGAGLLIRSFGKLLRTDLGFQPDHVLAMEVPLPASAYPQASQIRNLYQRLAEEVPNLPGVKAAGIADDLPLLAAVFHTLEIEGRPQVGKPPAVAETWVLGNYLQTMRIPLVAGRLFTGQDGPNSMPVVLISRGMAKKYWPGQDPIGKRLRHEENQPWMTVVGVVGDVNDGPVVRPPQPHIYIPFLQLSDNLTAENLIGVGRSMNLAVRTAGDPSALASAVVAQVHSLDPDLAVANITTMPQVIGSSLAGPRFNTSLLALFAGFALFFVGYWSLRCAGLRGHAAAARNRHSHGAGSPASPCAPLCARLGNPPGVSGSGIWHYCRPRAYPPDEGLALRSGRHRSPYFCRCHFGAAAGGAACLLCSRAPRHPGRSSGRIALRIGLLTKKRHG
jgi:hypothetical protein